MTDNQIEALITDVQRAIQQPNLSTAGMSTLVNGALLRLMAEQLKVLNSIAEKLP